MNLGMAFKGLDARLVLIIPDFNESVIGTTHQVRFVAAVVVVDTIHTLFMSVQCEVGRVRPKLPNLYCLK